jgi:hypothetical protein
MNGKLRITFCSACLLFLTAGIHCQSKPVDLERDLYFRALVASIEANFKAYANSGGKDYRNVIIAYDVGSIEHVDVSNFPTEIGQFHIDYVNREGLFKRFQQAKKEKNWKDGPKRIPYSVVRIMRNDGDVIKIGVTDYWYSFKKSVHNHELEGGMMVRFRYDCEKSDWVIVDVNHWGV